jgi:hypothetical protein
LRIPGRGRRSPEAIPSECGSLPVGRASCQCDWKGREWKGRRADASRIEGL